jgi:hypothetical protein
MIVPVLPHSFSEMQNLRTIIVIADIHRGLYSASPAPHLDYKALLRASPLSRDLSFVALCKAKCEVGPTIFDLPALVRHHPLYFLLRVCRELCFW